VFRWDEIDHIYDHRDQFQDNHRVRKCPDLYEIPMCVSDNVRQAILPAVQESRLMHTAQLPPKPIHSTAQECGIPEAALIEKLRDMSFTEGVL
jgi:hypothetical protein